MALFKRIDHVEIVTDQPEPTERFYVEVLGFTVKSRDRVDTPVAGVSLDLTYLELGGTVVELIEFHGMPVDPAPANEHLGYRLLAIEVEDMTKAIDHLRAQGVPVVWGPKVRDTYARAEIRDPNGYHIELRQWFR
jgi:glyoxylase I family protein